MGSSQGPLHPSLTTLEQALHLRKKLDASLSCQGLHGNSIYPEELFISNPDTSGESILKLLWVRAYGFLILITHNNSIP
jgi:hypothetical protein